MKKILPASLRGQLIEVMGKLNIGKLPDHPYPEQFSPNMDFPKIDWASRFFLIAATPRCGSHFLGHMLGATGECGVPLEYFSQRSQRYWGRRFKTTSMDELFPRLVQHRTSPNGTFVLKAHWDQYQPYIGSVDEMTRGFGFEKVIWISRRNQLSQAISRVIAQQTGVWISGAQPKGESKFDYDAIVRSAQYIRNGNINWRDYVSKIPLKNKMNILYEDLLSDEAVRNEVQSFLKLKTKLIPAERTRKQSSEVNAAWQRRFVDEVTDNDRWILEPPDWLQ